MRHPYRHQAASGTILHTPFEALVSTVSTVSVTEPRRRLYALIDEVGQSHQPVQIHGKRGNAGRVNPGGNSHRSIRAEHRPRLVSWIGISGAGECASGHAADQDSSQRH